MFEPATGMPILARAKNGPAGAGDLAAHLVAGSARYRKTSVARAFTKQSCGLTVLRKPRLDDEDLDAVPASDVAEFSEEQLRRFTELTREGLAEGLTAAVAEKKNT